MRTCTKCGEEKEINKFVKGTGDLYRYLCKDCKNSARRTGRPNTGRFKPGHDKGKRFEIGHEPWYKVKGVDNPGKGKGDWESDLRFFSLKYKEWRTKVFDRDRGKCVKCSSTNRLSAHHIKPWNEEENLRFDVNNGMSLCNSCHAKEEGLGIRIRPE